MSLVMEKVGENAVVQDNFFALAEGHLKEYERCCIENARLMKKVRENNQIKKRIERVVDMVQEESYGSIISLKYLKFFKEEEIAASLSCDITTVKRQKKAMLRLVWEILEEEFLEDGEFL